MTMPTFGVTILGCGAATPTLMHYPASQVVDVRDKLFMIDCGEGTQLQFRRAKLKFGRLNHIFISHLHGDHCLGLIGLISTLALLGRIGKLFIYSPAGLKELMQPQLDFFCREIPFEVVFNTFDTKESEVIYEDKSLTVSTIPLVHRVPCAGFLFKEKGLEPNIIKEKIDFYKIPIKEIVKIKQGADFVTPDGKIVPNSQLVRPVKPIRSYAYCSDTAYNEKMIPIIENVSLLYHEATFETQDAARAKETRHSTAEQAATIAKKANVGELLLGHFSARYYNNNNLLKEAKQIFKNSTLANEQMCKKL